jgi:hypothetical protein
MKTFPRWLALGLAGAAVALALTPVSASAVADGNNPQAPKTGLAAAAAAPDSCLYLSQPTAHKYRSVNNVPWVHFATTHGTNWFNVVCSSLSFNLLPGQEALVDLTAVAELDCQGGLDGWCGGRWLVNGLPLSRPDNSNRGDTYSWDSVNGGNNGVNNWRTGTVDQLYRAICNRETNPNGCTYRVQLQSRFENGATQVWIDDLKTTIDVSVGPVIVVNGPTTP